MTLFDRILAARGLSPAEQALFVSPDYEKSCDPFLLPDMSEAVDRLVAAHKAGEKIAIYGDYDIDGLTATTLLLDALERFGFQDVAPFIPNRFTEGYGLTIDAVERIIADGAELIVTVDCGSLSHKEIARAAELGVDVIVTDHHNVAPEQPSAVAVVNPKRLLQDNPSDYKELILSSDRTDLYPFLDLPGVGVAFKLVQALQTRLEGIPKGQEKWYLDLVALGTVCDVVTLLDENRTHVYWGLKVLAKTQRPGLRALMAVSGVEPQKVNAGSLGFALGPRMNAAGRLETALIALNLLTSKGGEEAMKYARLLDDMNKTRRQEQADILKAAIVQAEKYADDKVLVVSAPGWNHGIVGIVAAKLLERFKKPTFVIEEGENEAKGSARSYGDFSVADAIRAADDIIIKGGGHRLAAGVTLPVANIDMFRRRVNEYYASQKLENQEDLLLPRADVDARFDELEESVVLQIASLEPFGKGNPQPILRTENVTAIDVRRMGDKGQHVKILFRDENGVTLSLLAFSAPENFFLEIGQAVTVWYSPDINEWQGRRAVEGRLVHLET